MLIAAIETKVGLSLTNSSSSSPPCCNNETAENVVAAAGSYSELNETAAAAASTSSLPGEAGSLPAWLIAEMVNLSVTLNSTGLDAADCITEGNTTRCWPNGTSIDGDLDGLPRKREYWALVLLIFPVFTVFGNVLVILSVYKERSLHTVTNYFIVSLAVADLLVAALVMPFAVYVLVNVDWELSPTVCDFYIAMDVICSTSSIFNLVAISIDRFIAVTQPIKYAKQKSNKRIVMTIAIVWVVSAAIGSPIVLGLNTAPDKDPLLCIFYNTDFIIYSALSSFYIPCIIMVFLYYRIFRAIRARAQKAAAAKKPHPSEIKPGSIIENVPQIRRLQETALSEGRGGSVGSAGPGPGGGGEGKGSPVVGSSPVPPGGPNAGESQPPIEADAPTLTESGSQNDDEEQRTPVSEDCHIIPNDKSTDFMLTPVREETPPRVVPDGNNDSGYAASTLDDGPPVAPASPAAHTPGGTPLNPPSTPHVQLTAPPSPQQLPPLTPVLKGSASRRNGSAPGLQVTSPEGGVAQKEGKRPPKKKSRFTLARAHKSSCKKREKSSAKRERKATKTLAIVLGVFLICWVPFFTCNIMDALCQKLQMPSCQASMTSFMLTTWLGYMNSFINPVIYTIFNPEFRKAFKKILTGH